MRNLRVLLAVATVFLAIGGAIAWGAVARDVRTSYGIRVSAPPGVDWTVWLPGPEVPMAVDFAVGGLRSIGPVETAHGTLENVSGTGEVTVQLVGRRTAFSAGPLGNEGFVNLTGRDGLRFWVWRSSASPAAEIGVWGSEAWSARHLGGERTCGGLSYNGSAGEGWTLLEPFLIGDYMGALDGVPWLEAVAPGFLAAGSGTLALAVVSRRRPEGGA